MVFEQTHIKSALPTKRNSALKYILPSPASKPPLLAIMVYVPFGKYMGTADLSKAVAPAS